MKLSLIRFCKKIFIQWQLHRIFGVFGLALANLLYLTQLSKWAFKNRKVAYNDFPCKWDYLKRYPMYKWVMDQENLYGDINYIEFGVAGGESFKWFLQQNKSAGSRFYGFDTFDGLPEDWGSFKKGSFSNNNRLPEINDARGTFTKAFFSKQCLAFCKTLTTPSAMC